MALRIHLFVLFIALILWIPSCVTGDRDCNDPQPISIKTGAERLVDDQFRLLNGRNVGLITNHTGRVADDHLADLMHGSSDLNLVALFGPEHGIRGDARGHIDFEVDESTGLPVHSLYGETRRPTTEMLEEVEVLVFDVQDIGPRFYTYISTMVKAMEEAAAHNIPFVVLDRPNPLGGERMEGFLMDPEYRSFVGYIEIPVTHGMTVGELALMVRGEGMADGVEELDLHIVEMEGWNRHLLWPQLNMRWNRPSPNIPDFETALVYPGSCLFGGTHGSQGRGTTEPFLLVGGPWADYRSVADDLNARNLPGVEFEGLAFTPEPIHYLDMASDPPLQGERLQGVRYRVTDMASFRPVETGVHVLHAFYVNASPEERDTFFSHPTLGRLTGSDRFYEMITAGASAEEIVDSWRVELEAFASMRVPYLLYD